MTEQDLIDLKLERTDVSAEESGHEAFHYYALDFGNGALSIISNASDETDNGEWFVEIFEDNTIRFTDRGELELFINIIKNNTK
jgi:hypothetical protein